MKTPKDMKNITIVRNRDGSTSWRVMIRRSRLPQQTRTFKSYTEALQYRNKTHAEFDAGKQFITSPSKAHTVRLAIDRFIDENLVNKNRSDAGIIKQQLGWWKAELGTIRLIELTPSVIVSARAKLLKAKKTPATANRYMAALSSVLTAALNQWEWVTKHPIRGRIKSLPEHNARTECLDLSEQSKLLEACRQVANTADLHDIVLTALHTGLRKTEITSLLWSDIRPAEKNGLRRLVVRKSKNHAQRAVPIGPRLSNALDLRKSKAKEGQTLIFPGSDSTKGLIFDGLWRRARTWAELPTFRFHDLRHTFASHLAMEGASLLAIQNLLGHKTLNMVMRYAHLSKAHLDEAIINLDKRLAE